VYAVNIKVIILILTEEIVKLIFDFDREVTPKAAPPVLTNSVIKSSFFIEKASRDASRRLNSNSKSHLIDMYTNY
jgi:hypothetical protein